MPTVSMFFGIIIRMYYDDHNPPHFHAYYNKCEAIFTFDGKLLKGTMPKKELKLIAAWCIIHQKELEANWLLLKNNESIFDIKPLS